MNTTFLRLLAADDKAAALAAATDALRAGQPAYDAYAVDPASFRQVPGAPFAYWVSEHLREVFTQMPPLESDGRVARRTNSTDDDVRYFRCSWEVPCEASGKGTSWIPLAKGGEFSRYYADIHLAVDWDDSQQTYRGFLGTVHRPLARPASAGFFFRPGLTYPLRTQGGFSVRVLPAGSIFGNKGPSIFLPGDDSYLLLGLLAITNSLSFRTLLSLQMAFGSYEVGVVQRTPVPKFGEVDVRTLAALAREAHDLKRDRDRDDEVTHPFTCPAFVRLRHHATLAEAGDALDAEDTTREQRLAEIQREIDDHAFDLYGFTAEDRAQVEGGKPGDETAEGAEDTEDIEEREESEDTNTLSNSASSASSAVQSPPSASSAVGSLSSSVANLLMYAVGCAFGRWDARIGRDPSLAPALADPFAPLPVCAPGALVGPDGLPATRGRIVSEQWLRARPDAITLPPEVAEGWRLTAEVAEDTEVKENRQSETNLSSNSASSASSAVSSPVSSADDEYPLPIAWDGILPDDPEHPADIVRRVRAVLELFWGERAEAIEREVCGILGVRDLRDWLRSPRGFFDHHIGRYSKSRRKAPIYWLLQSPGKQYGLWLYYHRLDADLLFKALTLYVQPKLRREETRLEELRAARQAAGTSGPEPRRAAQAVEREEALLADLREFHERLDRAAKLYLTPDLNDGVVLTIAPLHELVPWREAKSYWEQLLAGKYEWSSIGRQLREKGMVK